MNALVVISGAAEPVASRTVLSVDEICKIAVKALEERGRDVMDTIHQIDKSDPQELYSRSIRRTVLEPIVDALRMSNVPIDYTYGSVQDTLELSPVAMHIAFCDCDSGASMRCDEAAAQLRGAIELERDGKLLTRSFDQGRQGRGH